MPKCDHGGQIFALAREIQTDFRSLLDFSANISPFSVKEELAALITKELDRIQHYPEDRDSDFLAALSGYCGAAPEEIIPGNGATELIYFLLRCLQPRSVLLPVPTFSEIPRACEITGAGCHSFPFIRPGREAWELDWDGLFSLLREESFDLLVLINPNNPTGALLEKKRIEEIIQFSASREIGILLDESFIDWAPEHSCLRYIKSCDHLFLVRSLTKFYAIPGLRLGYLISSERRINKMLEVREPWQVNQIAQLAGRHLLTLKARQAEWRARIAREREFLASQLRSIRGMRPYPSYTNFLLVHLETRPSRIKDLYQYLGQRRILIRTCFNWPGLSDDFFRLAVRSREENEILIERLKEFFQ